MMTITPNVAPRLDAQELTIDVTCLSVSFSLALDSTGLYLPLPSTTLTRTTLLRPLYDN